MRSLLKSVFAVLVFACALPAAAAEQVVIVNGVRLPPSALAALQLAYRTIIPNGRYWYDAASGLWGRDPQASGTNVAGSARSTIRPR